MHPRNNLQRLKKEKSKKNFVRDEWILVPQDSFGYKYLYPIDAGLDTIFSMNLRSSIYSFLNFVFKILRKFDLKILKNFS